MKADKYNNRKFFIGAMVIFVIAVFLVRLFFLQIVNYEKYFLLASNNALLRQTVFPARGLMFDRNGTLLVSNRLAYDVMITTRDVRQFDTLALCRILNITPEFFDQRLAEIRDRRRNRGFSPHVPQVFLSQLSVEENAILQEKLHLFPGFSLRQHSLREYSFPYAAHLIGSMGEVTRRMIEEDSFYALGDFAGQSGLEFTFERQLRGEKGFNLFLRDSRGRIQGRYNDGASDQEPQAGENITLTIDILLQGYGEKLMQGKRGGIVAIEPRTGEILAMVSYPTFDPALLVGRQRSENFRQLRDDPQRPLLNRATQAQYSPGSTLKVVQALVSMQSGVTNEHTVFPCAGRASLPIRCTHSHGSPVGLINAIQQSCNPYFWFAFRNMLEKNGFGVANRNFKAMFDIWREDMMSFGLGQTFDNDINEQSRGNIPTVAFYDRMFGERGWRSMTIRSLSIGQGEILATPLQMANMTAAIVNKGYYRMPHAVRRETPAEQIHTNVNPRYFPVVIEGMRRVSVYGTGRHHPIPGISMGGKTGTVQNPHGENHSMFIGFAPAEDPQIVIAVVVENAGFGSQWANPIASLMMEKYLRREIDPRRAWIEERMINANFLYR